MEIIIIILLAIAMLILTILTIVNKDREVRAGSGILNIFFYMLFTVLLINKISDKYKEKGYKDCLANSKNYTVEIKYKQINSIYIPCDTIITKIK